MSGPRTILLVDDDRDVIDFLKLKLTKILGHDVVLLSAVRAANALKPAQVQQPDLIITDWEMPGMDGIALIKALKADLRTANIPVIMCTGVMTKSTNLKTALEAGAIDFIRKPPDPIELEARVYSILALVDSYRLLEARNKALQAANDKLDWLSATDPMTGLANRRSFSHAVQEEIKQADRYEDGFALIMADLDHFKQINDTFGHGVGDDVLMAASKVLQEHVRDSDMVCRWGGEEFLIMLRRTSQQTAAVVAQKLCDQLAQIVLPPVKRITGSFGLACWHPGETFDQVCRRADDKLYYAKQSGRNQICG